MKKEGKGKSKKSDTNILENNIKMLFIIYDLIRTAGVNIDEFNTLKIFINSQVKKMSFTDYAISFKNKSYSTFSNFNKKTKYFIDLISNILSYDYVPRASNTQFLLSYHLVYMFHKDIINEEKQHHNSLFNQCAETFFEDTFEKYCEILKMIGLLDNKEDNDIQFHNKCLIIKNINSFEFNSAITNFALSNGNIPQYNVSFQKIDSSDDVNIFQKKIISIYNLLDVIRNSIEMSLGNIRFNIFNKYINQTDKLDAVNEVLSSLKKHLLPHLDGKDLNFIISLSKENIKFLTNQNKEDSEIIKNLFKEIDPNQAQIKKMNENLSKTKSKLIDIEKRNLKMSEDLEQQIQYSNDIYEELQNIKYRDVSNYIINYFINILNTVDFENAQSEDYTIVINYIKNEIESKYSRYNQLLVKEGISIQRLLNILVTHKKEYNSCTHDENKDLEEFIRLITNFENKEIGDKFKLLFKKTPLLEQYCFNKNNRITRVDILNAMIKLSN